MTDENRARVPVSYAQHRLWLLDQLQPRNTAYNIAAGFRLRGQLDHNALRLSLHELVSRHESLRTTFDADSQGPFQVVHFPDFIEINEVDLTHLDQGERKNVATRFVSDEALRSFDLKRDPLFRPTLLRVTDSEHILLFVMHHIVSDGWSMRVLTSELSALYNAFKEGKPSPLPIPLIQYADFTMWQRNWLEGDVFDSQLSYWKEVLADMPPPIPLHTDNPRPPMQSFNGSTISRAIPNESATMLRRLSSDHGATLFMTLLAAFDVMLYRFTGQEDLVVGIPVANRNHSEIEGLIGFFVNTLAIRTDLTGNPSFLELLGRVKRRCLNAYAHQDLPFEKLVEELHPERDRSRHPIFQVMFTLQRGHIGIPRMIGLDVEAFHHETRTAVTDIVLAIGEEDDRMSAKLTYNTDLFGTAAAESMIDSLGTLIDEIGINPRAQISSYGMLSKNERNKILFQWNDTFSDYPRDKCVHQLFEEQVEKSSTAIAISFNEHMITYDELNRRANRLSHFLIELGVHHETLVATFLERGIDMIVGLLAIMKAGGAYVPLDPGYPRMRLTYLLDDTQAPIILTQRSLIARLPQTGAQVIAVDDDESVLEPYPSRNPGRRSSSDNTVYVIYTSGSTGTPKGVMVSHKSLINLVYWHVATYELNGSAATGQVASQSFDASAWEIWPSLCSGARLVIADGTDRVNPTKLWKWICQSNLTSVFIPTSIAEAILSSDEVVIPLKLRSLLTGGDQLHLKRRPKGFNIHNHYGPTESTVVATALEITSEVPSGLPTIGRPIFNTQIYIVDSHLNPVPIGVPGEILIGGEGLAKGYLNRPELTDERFIPNPFDPVRSPRLYRTADLARYLPDGNIEFLGRIDEQVKIRGFRVELGEIETTLAQHKAIKEARVIVRDNEEPKRLVAYFVARGKPPSALELRTFLTKWLPDYMVPSAYVGLEAIPLSHNGKIDRSLLPAPEHDHLSLPVKYAAPTGETERTLAQIWQEALSISNVGRFDNFFDLGGHSLLAIHLVERVRQEFQFDLPVELILHATLRDLAEFIRESRKSIAKLDAIN